MFCSANQMDKLDETQLLNSVTFSLSENVCKPVVLQSFLLNTLETLQTFKYAGKA
jgi:hypothetical protein